MSGVMTLFESMAEIPKNPESQSESEFQNFRNVRFHVRTQDRTFAAMSMSESDSLPESSDIFELDPKV